jgi:hypothetical protein
MFGRVLREPLVHFLVLALIVFAGYRILESSDAKQTGHIVVTSEKVEQIATRFAQIWQRPPTPQELKGLIDEEVKDEIYVREAVALGLDRDDVLIRRRLRQKMELLDDMGADALSPSDAELDAFLGTHPERFAIDPAVSFQQVFFNPQRRGSAIAQTAEDTLTTLRTHPEIEAITLGDASLLPVDAPLTSLKAVRNEFGSQFADAVDKAKLGVWAGPIASGFGLHIVRVYERQEGRIPELREVRDTVLREWTNDKRKQLQRDRLAELLRRYDVTVEGAPVAGGGK